MDDRQAKRITNALNRGPGLVVITGHTAGSQLRTYGRPELKVWDADFGPTNEESDVATKRAIALAMIAQIPLVILFSPEAADD